MRTLTTALALFFAMTTLARAEFVADATDFHCLQEGVRIEGKHFYVYHKNKRKLKKAVRVAERDLPKKKYPVGTVIQLLPLEAMVKRGGKYNKEGGGWEWFRLDFGGKTIIQRGEAEVANNAGSCQGCHTAAASFDFICEGHDIAPIPLSEETIAALQAADPRCH
jgi:cytochrome P460